MKEKNFLFLVILISLAIKIPLAMMTEVGFGVDEALYQSLARSLLNNGFYGIKTEFYDERFVSPVFPIVQSLFLYLINDVGMLLVSPIFSSLMILPIFYLAKDIRGSSAARFSAIFLLLNPALIILGSRPLTESLSLFLFSCSILFFYRSWKNKVYLIPLLVTASLTFLTRYQHGALLFFFLIASVIYFRRFDLLKSKFFLYSLVAGLIVFAPWLFFNYQSYGSFFGSAASQASTDVGFSSSFYLYFIYIFIVLGLLFPLVFHSAFMGISKRKIDLMIFGFLVVFLSQILLLSKVAEERYLAPTIPFAAVFSFSSFEYFSKKKWKNKFKAIFYLLLVGNLLIGLYGSYFYLSNPRYTETKQALLYARSKCSDPIMSNVFTSVWRYTEFENIPYTSDAVKLRELAKKHDVSCVVISLYEAPFEDILKESSDFKLETQVGKLSIYRPVI